MNVNTNLHQSGTIIVGEDLYGHSLEDLADRILSLKNEIARVELELGKKKTERLAADDVFKSKG